MKRRSEIPKPEEQLSELFGSYKAEWLKERLFDFFTEPSYFPELTTSRPCMLVGGRGTGKTTVLRCLSYEGQFALSGKNVQAVPTWSYYGLYYRVNTNRVTAFKGPELSEQEWIRLFSHYFNILIVDLLLKFLEWYQLHSEAPIDLSPTACSRVAASLHLPSIHTPRELGEQVDYARIRFESYINNVADQSSISLSMQGAPIDVLTEEISRLQQFAGKHIFFLLDEYENFEDYQQQVVNTLIKHSGQLYSFKVGVRELGWRRRVTLNENEQLISPADYVKINITEKLEGRKFADFARAVCNGRISQLKLSKRRSLKDIRKALPGMTEDEEADQLGIQDRIAKLRELLAQELEPSLKTRLVGLSPLELYFLDFWAKGERTSVLDMIQDFAAHPVRWKTRFNNYKHATLYTIRRGRRGIRKHYAGWDTFTQLAGGNIRYLLELVDQSFLRHLRDGEDLSFPVSAATQTLAAQGVGKKNLSELEGLSVHGAQLTKLLLGLGRIFQVMAANPYGHAPEVNQFHLSDEVFEVTERTSEEEAETDRLLTAAVMHLALVRWTGNKPMDESETREYDYMVHPIFSAFFEFSYRRKRKMMLTGKQLIGLVKRPQETIREVLQQNNRTEQEGLPEQLALFEAYYSGNA